MIRHRDQHLLNVGPGKHFPEVMVSLDPVVAGLAESLRANLDATSGGAA